MYIYNLDEKFTKLKKKFCKKKIKIKNYPPKKKQSVPLGIYITSPLDYWTAKNPSHPPSPPSSRKKNNARKVLPPASFTPPPQRKTFALARVGGKTTETAVLPPGWYISFLKKKNPHFGRE